MSAVAVAGAGMFLQAKGAADRGAAAKATAYRNADVAQRQAADAIARGILPGVRARMRGGAVIGTQMAHFAASGALVDVGSSGDVTRQTRIITDEDEQVIRTNAAREAYGYTTQAQRYRQEGVYAEAEAKQAILESVIGGVGKMALLGAKGWLDMPEADPSWAADMPPAPEGS